MIGSKNASRTLPLLAVLLAGCLLIVIADEPASPPVQITAPGHVTVADGNVAGCASCADPDEPITVQATIDGVPIGPAQFGTGEMDFEFPIPPDAAGKEIVIRAITATGSTETRVPVLQ